MSVPLERVNQSSVRYSSLRRNESSVPHIVHSQTKQATVVFINPSELGQTCIKSGFLCGKISSSWAQEETKKVIQISIVQLRTTLKTEWRTSAAASWLLLNVNKLSVRTGSDLFPFEMIIVEMNTNDTVFAWSQVPMPFVFIVLLLVYTEAQTFR